MFNTGGYVPAGGAATLPTIDADRAINIITDGDNLGDGTMSIADFLEATFYDSLPPVINSFTGGAGLEKGEDTLTRTLSFNVSAPSGGTIASIIVTRSDGGAASADLKSGTGNQTGTHDVTLTANTNCTFTLTVTSADGKTATSTTAFTFLNRI